MIEVSSDIQHTKHIVLRVTIQARVEEWQQIKDILEAEANKDVWSAAYKMYVLIGRAIRPLFEIIKVDETDLPEKESERTSE